MCVCLSKQGVKGVLRCSGIREKKATNMANGDIKLTVSRVLGHGLCR